MLRSSLAIIIAILSWIGLLLGTSTLLEKLFPELYFAPGMTEDWRIFAFMLIASIFFAMASGFICAWISKEDDIQHVFLLGFILLVLAVYTQSQHWEVMPMWFHIPFLAFLLPATIAGGDLRIRSKKWY